MIGVFGGSGFYEFLDDARSEEVDTPHGPPSAPYTLGTIDGVEVAFLPRHGQGHTLPPHQVPFKANVWGMRELGVERIISPSAVGSLDLGYEPGHFAVADQLFDRTWGRDHTFVGSEVSHSSFADPYCSELRPLAVAAMRSAGATVHDGGTVVVINGPRFSTRAESAWFAAQGWELINMTQLPEASLARELGLCFVNISVITDYDVGIDGSEPVTHDKVLEMFEASVGTLKEGIAALVPQAAGKRTCSCGS